jgi:hypothetical protein
MTDRFLSCYITAATSKAQKARLLAAAETTGRPQSEIVRAAVELILYRIERGWRVWEEEDGWAVIVSESLARAGGSSSGPSGTRVIHKEGRLPQLSPRPFQPKARR